MKKPTAYLIIDNLKGPYGTKKLYYVDEEVYYSDINNSLKTHFIIASKADLPVVGPETYIFPADSTGEIISFSELEGSIKGNYSHEETLKRAGYKISNKKYLAALI